MGKGGRIACIFTPMILTIASLVFLALIETGGWIKSSGTNNFYFFQANLTNLDVSGASGVSTTTLTQALQAAQSEHALDDVYQIHLWNYCSSNTSSPTISACSKRQSEFVFDPVEVWGLATINASSGTQTSTSSSAVASAEAELKNQTETIENDLLGESGARALAIYRTVAKWMFIAYEVSFWTTVATIAAGLLAICSRWGSLLTWILALISSIITLIAVVMSTVLFSVLVGVLGEILKPYQIYLSLSTSTLAIAWLAVLCSWAATLFWLFSICCCSGRSNPHHRSNKGGLWNAEPKGQGYGGYGDNRGMKVGRTGGGYERVASPYQGDRGSRDIEHVPLHGYAQPNPYSVPNPYTGHAGGYEPFRSV